MIEFEKLPTNLGRIVVFFKDKCSIDDSDENKKLLSLYVEAHTIALTLAHMPDGASKDNHAEYLIGICNDFNNYHVEGNGSDQSGTS